MPTGVNWASRPHHPPGNDRAMRQKKAIADGYAMAQSPSPVKVDLPNRTTGGVEVPGWTRKGR